MRSVIFAAAVILAAPASAEVVSASPNGFEVQEVVNLVVPQPSAYAAFGQVGQWWSKDHTYSGDAARMRTGCSFSTSSTSSCMPPMKSECGCTI